MWHMTCDTWRVTPDMWHLTLDIYLCSLFLFSFLFLSPFWYRWYYPHTSRESVPPVWGIFFSLQSSPTVVVHWISPYDDSAYKLQCMFVCVFVPSAKTQNRVDWRLRVNEHIAKIKTKTKRPFFSRIFCLNCLGLWLSRLVPRDKVFILANQATVHSGGVFVCFVYMCFHSLKSRDSMYSVCGILLSPIKQHQNWGYTLDCLRKRSALLVSKA